MYIYYGNPSASNQQNKTAVWDSHFLEVLHLDESTGTTLFDSTSNGNNGSKVSSSSPTPTSSGEIGGAQSFNGTSDYVVLPPSMTAGLTVFSVSFWTQTTDSGSNGTYWHQPQFVGDASSGDNSGDFGIVTNNGDLGMWSGLNSGGDNALVSSDVINDNHWHHISAINDGSTIWLYLDGQYTGKSLSSGEGLDSLGWYLGAQQYLSSGTANFFHEGSIDEFRFSNSARSAGWIGTEYNNQSSPSTFFSVGSQQGSGLPPPVAPPVFNPSAGTYTSAQTVTISTTTSGASIRYTLDGSTPSETAGTLYSGPVTVSSTTTINAIAYKSGMTDSTVASAAYTIAASVVMPTFNPPAGTYSSAQTVTISTTTSGASIRYTTDGSTPSETAGTLYNGPVTVSATATIKAIAYASGMTDSSIASATYTINTGSSNSAQFVRNDATTKGSWKGVYGGDGYNVIDDTTAYPSYVTVTPTGQSNYIWNSSSSDAWALQKAFSDTDRIEATWYTGGSFTIDLNFTAGATHQLAVYCLDESGGSRTETISVLDGVTSAVLDSRNVSSFVNGQYLVWNLSGHVVLNITNTGSPNAVISGLFFDVPRAAAPPWFDPPARVWSTAQSVSLTTMAGASIRYTTDGSTPSETAGTLYSAPININSTTTIKALAYMTGLNDSAVVSGTYTISPLPSPWTDQDIGAVGVSGSGAFDPTSATFTVQGSGTNVFYAPDQFNYLSQPLSGDGVIIARVVSEQNLYQATKAGVMIRETTDPSAAFAFVSLAPDSGGVYFSERPTGAGPNYNGIFSASAPIWVKLVRQGNTFTGYYSSDGNTWTAAGSPYTVSMAANVLVGLAVVSTYNNALTTAVFDNVSIVAAIGVSVSPTTASLSANQTKQFTATVTDTSNTAVTWSISPNVGTISSTGLYTAPSSISSQQTVTVTATSVADTTKSGTATVTLTTQ
jgi:regulation of enolase protein 1 (concanavalin A-like superfamily)